MITLIFADDQAVIASTEDNLQRIVYSLGNIAAEYNLKISTDETKVMVFSGKEPIRTKVIIKITPIDVDMDFNYPGVSISNN